MQDESETIDDQDDLDWQWVSLAEHAAASLDLAPARAEADWHALAALSEAFSTGDPRSAAAHNGLGVALALGGDRDAARAQLVQAVDAWRAGEAWLMQAHLPLRARSSLFHFRLERRHRVGYEQLARQRLVVQLERGLQCSVVNLSALDQSERGMTSLVAAVAQQRGGFLHHAREQRWAIDLPAQLSDEGRLMAAVLFGVDLRGGACRVPRG